MQCVALAFCTADIVHKASFYTTSFRRKFVDKWHTSCVKIKNGAGSTKPGWREKGFTNEESMKGIYLEKNKA